MDGYRPAFFVTAALLAISVGYQWWSPPSPGASPDPAPTALEPDVDDAARELDDQLRTVQRDLLQARAELSKCQTQAWDMAADLMRGDVGGAAAGQGGSRGDDLCAVSQTLLRKQWEASEPKARELFGKHLGTPSWIDNDMKWRFERHGERFDLAERDQDALERGYQGIWHRHGDRMRALAAEGDWDGVAETVRGFWREEDELLGEVLRPDELATFEQSEAGFRRSLLAMLATYADRPWDAEALSW
ncbi:MAG: hypothetical protein RIF41_07950 [Polyangiaceae bacterium]